MNVKDTLSAHASEMNKAKRLFSQKNAIYGDSWQEMDLDYIADRMMVKCERITQLMRGEEAKVEEGIPSELTDIINYALIGLMQIKKISPGSMLDGEVEVLYDSCLKEVNRMLVKKNNDYNDAWRKMRYSSLITQIKVKLSRILNEGEVAISKNPVSAIDQFQDIANYAVFAILHPNAPYNS